MTVGAIEPKYKKLFDYLYQDFHIALLTSDMDEIVGIVKEILVQPPIKDPLKLKQIKLMRKQKEEMRRIDNFFLEAVEPISNSQEKHMVAVKILSRLACFSDKLTRK